MAHPDALAPGADALAGADAVTALPEVRKISPADLADALKKGVDDFRAMPTHAVFLCLLYPIVGIVLLRATLGFEILPLLYPLAAGFALIGPFAAIGLYELSRRREQGLETSWQHAFDVVHSRSFGAIVALGLVLLVIFGIWLAVAHAIYVANFGYREPASLTGFAREVLTTRAGLNLMLVGNLVGLLFALVVLVISVVSFPLLLDRNVGAAGAVVTSVRAVAENPGTMLLWGLIVAAALLLGSIPLFFGLAVVMPVLGHATWHLYRKTVVADRSPPQEFRPPPEGRRSAADFPISLFVRSGKD